MQSQFHPADGQDIQDLWFAGVHSDVGGGYPETEGGLWRESYTWMLNEAKSAGLLTDAKREDEVWTRVRPPARAWTEPQHESLKGAWWLAELVPKPFYNVATKKRRIRLGLGRGRDVPDDARFHRSVQDRIRDAVPPYGPKRLAGVMEGIKSGELVGPRGGDQQVIQLGAPRTTG